MGAEWCRNILAVGFGGPHPKRLGDRFELKSQAGAGGMGTVYQAIDRRTGDLVAVKILNVRNVSDVGRFDQEALLLQELAHPGIVRYVDHGLTSHGDPYIAMEWLEGETLDQRLARGKLAAAGVANLAARVLEALAAAHEHGIVHRDIKPSNVFLSEWRLFNPRVIDFGVARRVEDPRRYTRRGATVGTPSYSSPEQARADATIDGRADIFSLGCVLFECLTGRPPFHGPSAKQVLTDICLTPVPRLQERWEDGDPELVQPDRSDVDPGPPPASGQRPGSWRRASGTSPPGWARPGAPWSARMTATRRGSQAVRRAGWVSRVAGAGGPAGVVPRPAGAAAGARRSPGLVVHRGPGRAGAGGPRAPADLGGRGAGGRA